MATETKETTENNDTDTHVNVKFLLGQKQGMTQIFDEAGEVHPVTVVKTSPMTVLQVKTVDTDGYEAIQFGAGERNESNISKAQKGHFNGEAFRFVREYRPTEDETLPEVNVGDVVSAGTFEAEDTVDVSGVSKGKGFQGVVKRHGFSGGPRTHGQKHSERAPGSIGATGPQRVLKNVKMAGRMGGERKTVQNLTIKKVDAETGDIYIKGALPGSTGTLLEIRAVSEDK